LRALSLSVEEYFVFKLNPVLLNLVAAQDLMFPISLSPYLPISLSPYLPISLSPYLPISLSWAAELNPYTPEINDNKSGAYFLYNGSTQTLRDLPQFAPGEYEPRLLSKQLNNFPIC